MADPAPRRATWADLELGTWSDDDVARIEPWDAVELRLIELWG